MLFVAESRHLTY